ncbi:MAG: hypothetical protein HOW97_19630 [Catenulispora sp.]|nr:hypothetical protein [Catenulispora sp.]
MSDRRSLRRDTWIAAATALVLGVGSGVGLALTTTASGVVDRGPQPDRMPFFLAVSNLSTQPVAHYAGAAFNGLTKWDLKSTNGGETLGTVTVGGEKVDVLIVGGKTYEKVPPDLLKDLPAGTPQQALSGKWLTGSDTLAAMLPKGLGSPADLAAGLYPDLGKATDYPLTGTPATDNIDGASAFKVTTAQGVLYVSANAPYRVLRLAPVSGSTSPSPGAPSGSPSHVAAAGWSTLSQSADSGFGQTDFPAMAPDDTKKAFSDLVDQTKSLKDAVNVGIKFDFNQTGNLDCSESSCTVNENVTTSTTSAANAQLSGTVDTEMAATLTVNGQGAGGCNAGKQLPVNGSGTITCQDGAVAPVVQSIKAEKQREADAEAQASGHDVSIPYNLDFEASIELTAKANVQAEVDKMVGDEQGEQNAAQQNPPDTDCALNSFVAGTRVLMADGTSVPIEKVAVADVVDTAAPGAASPGRQDVTAIHVTDDDRDFADVTMTTPGGPEHITSTARHLYYDATTSAWTGAADLRPGDRLQSADGRPVTVASVRTFHGAARTYNLTVDTVHTFFILAGGSAVLVHNCGSQIFGHSTKCKCSEGGKPRIVRNPNGRRGNAATTAQLNDIRDEMLKANRDWQHIGGGTDAKTGATLPETTIRGPNGQIRHPDLTFRLPDGSEFYVNTVDTLADGVTMDAREMEAAIEIYMWGTGPIMIVPKP